MKLKAPNLLLIALLFFSGGAHAQSSLSEGTGRLQLQSAARHAYSRVQLADGSMGERFFVRAGDCVRRIKDCRDDRERAEFSGARAPIAQNTEVWSTWEVMLPSDFPLQGSAMPSYTFGQIHQHGTSGPELKITLFHDGLFVVMSDPHRLDDDPMNPIPSFKEIRVASPKNALGRWHQFKVQAIWSQGNNGILNVWHNGRKALSYQGRTTNAPEKLFFKYGLYRSFVSKCGGPCPDATVFYRNVRQGPTSASIQ